MSSSKLPIDELSFLNKTFNYYSTNKDLPRMKKTLEKTWEFIGKMNTKTDDVYSQLKNSSISNDSNNKLFLEVLNKFISSTKDLANEYEKKIKSQSGGSSITTKSKKNKKHKNPNLQVQEFYKNRVIHRRELMSKLEAIGFNGNQTVENYKGQKGGMKAGKTLIKVPVLYKSSELDSKRMNLFLILWSKLKDMHKDSGKYKFYSIDVDKHSDFAKKVLGKTYEKESYPVLMKFIGKDSSRYENDPFSYNQMATFIKDSSYPHFDKYENKFVKTDSHEHEEVSEKYEFELNPKTKLNKPAEKPKMIDYYASWCGHCVQLKPIWQKLKKNYSDKVDFSEFDVEGNQALFVKKHIFSYPTIRYVKKGGMEELDYSEYNRSYEALSKFIENVVLK